MRVAAQRRAIYVAVLALVSAGSWARAQSTAATTAKNAPAALPLTIAMPEPASRAILAVDLLSAAVLIYVFRRRTRGVGR